MLTLLNWYQEFRMQWFWKAYLVQWWQFLLQQWVLLKGWGYTVQYKLWSVLQTRGVVLLKWGYNSQATPVVVTTIYRHTMEYLTIYGHYWPGSTRTGSSAATGATSSTAAATSSTAAATSSTAAATSSTTAAASETLESELSDYWDLLLQALLRQI